MRDFFTILGGMGTLASESFVRVMNKRTKTNHDQDYYNYLLVNHATIPDRTAYIEDNSNESPLPYLLETIKQQELLHPEFIVLTCNTAHYFYDILQAATDIPILHMPRVAIKEIQNRIKTEDKSKVKVGVLATKGTIQAKVYEEEIIAQGYQVLLPTKQLQDSVTKLIYQEIKESGFLNKALYSEILEQMRQQGADIIILGCTELSLMAEVIEESSTDVVDAQSELIKYTMKKADKIKNS